MMKEYFSKTTDATNMLYTRMVYCFCTYTFRLTIKEHFSKITGVIYAFGKGLLSSDAVNNLIEFEIGFTEYANSKEGI